MPFHYKCWKSCILLWWKIPPVYGALWSVLKARSFLLDITWRSWWVPDLDIQYISMNSLHSDSSGCWFSLNRRTRLGVMEINLFMWLAQFSILQTSKEGRSYHQQVFEKCTELMLALQNIPIPVIAKVNGIAAAAGCQFVASCDIVIATDKSSFSTPGWEKKNGSLELHCCNVVVKCFTSN